MTQEFIGTERFEVVRRLGAGGMGVVYEAHDRERNLRLALKTLRGLGGQDLMQFKREFRALQDVQHPNLISLGELYEHHGQWFFTMELVRGTEIVSWVRSDDVKVTDGPTSLVRLDSTVPVLSPDLTRTPREASPPPRSGPSTSGVDEAKLRAALVQLSRALITLHASQKIHRDIKPSNILVADDGRVVLLDFGLVADAQPVGTGEARLAGTIPYIAPECVLQTVGPEADWYAVGVLLYEMLTSRLPFEGNPTQILLRKQRERPRPPHDLVPDVSEELEALCLELLEIDPRKRIGGSDVLRRLERSRAVPSIVPPPSRDSAFIGREGELAALEAALQDAHAGRVVTVLVEGESGIGKTALVRRFLSRIDEKTLVLSGRCYEREAVPYKAVDGVIDALCQELARLSEDELAPIVPENAALLAMMFPVLRRIHALAAASADLPPGVEPTSLRTKTFAALGEILARLAAGRGVVLTIDDLHWADADSLALLSELLRPRGGTSSSMLLVATLRSRTIELPGDVRRMFLGPLDHADALALAQELVERSGGRLDAAHVASEAEGHPLFIDELARHARRSVARPAVSLDDVLRGRIRSLPVNARRLLEVVSVAGKPLSERLAARAALADPSEFHRWFALLRGARLVRSTGTRGGDAVETSHDRIREAVTHALDDDTRRQCALRLATALEDSGGDDIEALASWFRAAGHPERAAVYAKEAAHRAAKAMAFERAVALFHEALALEGDGSDAHALRVGLADALASAGRGVEAASAYARAGASARSADEAHVLRRREAEELLRSGRIDAGLDALGGVLADVGLRLPRTPALALASALFHRTRLSLRGARYALREHPPRDLLRRVDAAWSVAVGLSLVDTVRAADFQARAMLLALDAGDPLRLSCGFAMAATFAASEASTRPLATEHLASAELLARLTDDPYTQAWIPLARAMLSLSDGHFRDALAEASLAHEMFRDRCVGASWEITSARSITFWALGYLGELRELGRRVDELLRESVERNDLYMAINVKTGAAHLTRLAANDPDASRRESAKAISEWSSRAFTLQHAFDLFTQCETLLYEGKAQAALARLRASASELERSQLLRMRTARIFMTDLRGRLEVASAIQTRFVERRAHLRRAEAAASDLEAQGLGWSTALAHALRAAISSARGRDPRRALENASRAFHAADMAAHAAVVDRALGDRERAAACEAAMRAEGIVDVERWSRMMLPLAAGR